MSVETNWLDPSSDTPRTITVYAMKENARPVGFAPWPEQAPETIEWPPTRKRKRKKRKS